MMSGYIIVSVAAFTVYFICRHYHIKLMNQFVFRAIRLRDHLTPEQDARFDNILTDIGTYGPHVANAHEYADLIYDSVQTHFHDDTVENLNTDFNPSLVRIYCAWVVGNRPLIVVWLLILSTLDALKSAKTNAIRVARTSFARRVMGIAIRYEQAIMASGIGKNRGAHVA